MNYRTTLLILATGAALLSAATTKVPAQAAQPDVETLQNAIAALQTQRNAALDTAATYEATIRTLQKKLSASEEKIKELEAKPPALGDQKKSLPKPAG